MKNNKLMTQKAVSCVCHGPNHSILFDFYRWTDNPELIIWAQFKTHNSFWKRLIIAVKYLFLNKTSDYPWQDTLLQKEDIIELRDFISKELEK